MYDIPKLAMKDMKMSNNRNMTLMDPIKGVLLDFSVLFDFDWRGLEAFEVLRLGLMVFLTSVDSFNEDIPNAAIAFNKGTT
jgi:hypothetical protein